MEAAAARFRPASLDALNFLLSDVRGALGPYLNVFLITQQHWSQTEVRLVPVFAVLAAAAALSIPAAAIDQARARGAREVREGEPADDAVSMRVLLECRPLVVFCVCALLFHLGNAPLLPLVGQKLAVAHA